MNMFANIFILLLWKSHQVLEVQLPGKKVVSAGAFWNGMQGKKLKKFDERKHFSHVSL